MRSSIFTLSGSADPHLDPDLLLPFLVDDYQRAATLRNNWVSLWQECYDLTLPENANFTKVAMPRTRGRDAIFDGTAPDAVDQLAASLLGNLTPPWVNWFGLAPGAEVTGDTRARLVPVLEQSTKIVQDQIDRSNLYTELHQCFLDLVVGGTACLYIVPNPSPSIVRFRAEAIPLSEIILGAGPGGRVNAVYRPRLAKARDIIDLYLDPLDFGLKEPNDQIEIIEFSVDINGHSIVGVMQCDAGSDPKLLMVKKVDTSPYIVFRWQKTPGTLFGRSPVMKALPDIKTANKVVELILKNASIAATGIWQADDDGVINPANIELVPGAIIPKAVGSAGLKPLEMPARFDVSQLVLDDLRARIRHALLADRFAQIDSSRMTATEILTRSDEASLLLSAIYGRLQAELLTPLLTRLYDLFRTRGEIADLPLDGHVVQLVHRAPLARAQATRGLEPIRTWIAAVGDLGPDAATTVNGPALARYIAETLGIPDYLVRPEAAINSTLTSSQTQGAA